MLSRKLLDWRSRNIYTGGNRYGRVPVVVHFIHPLLAHSVACARTISDHLAAATAVEDRGDSSRRRAGALERNVLPAHAHPARATRDLNI